MSPHILNINKAMFKQMRKAISLFILIVFISTSVKSPAYAQMASESQIPWMPKPGVMLHLSPEFSPAILSGITIHPENPLKFDFIIMRGDKNLSDADKQIEYKKLIKYFMASLAVPGDNQWVNLSPYEKNRIITDDFGKTEMGRDLLAEDYILKQITASLIYPEDGLGKKFWTKVYALAQKQYGTTDIPVNTFNKVWILPDNALIYEKGNTAYILKNHLKVMLEEDYLSLEKHAGINTKAMPEQSADAQGVNKLGSKVVREIILPALEQEVNEGKNFANLRQVYSGMILSAWFKRALRESLLSRIYANKIKLNGISQDPKNNEEIYHRYLRAYKKGVFNYIKEDIDTYTNQPIPRKYFSGGAVSEETAFPNGIPVEKREAVGDPIVQDAIIPVADTVVTDFVEPTLAAKIAENTGLGLSEVPNTVVADGAMKADDLADGWSFGLTGAKGLPYDGYRGRLTGSISAKLLSREERQRAIDILREIALKAYGKNGAEFRNFADSELESTYVADNEYVRGSVHIMACAVANDNVDYQTVISAVGILISPTMVSEDEWTPLQLQRPTLDPNIDWTVYAKAIKGREDFWSSQPQRFLTREDAEKSGQQPVYGKGFISTKDLKIKFWEPSSNISLAHEVRLWASVLTYYPKLVPTYARAVLNSTRLAFQRQVSRLTRFIPTANKGMGEKKNKNKGDKAMRAEDLADGWSFGLTGAKVLTYEGYRGTLSGPISAKLLSAEERQRAIDILREVALKAYDKNGTEFRDFTDAELESTYVADSEYVKGEVHIMASAVANNNVDYQTVISAVGLLIKPVWERVAEDTWSSVQLRPTLTPDVDWTAYASAMKGRETYGKGFISIKDLKIKFAGEYTLAQRVRLWAEAFTFYPKLVPTYARAVLNSTRLAFQRERSRMARFVPTSNKGMGDRAADKTKKGPGDSDKAMKGNPLGGIDFNDVNLNLQIKRDGQGVPLPISRQDLENIKINGLIPIIIDIKPMSASPLLPQVQEIGVQGQAKI